jgi:multidrug resistance efflux pump
MSQEQANDRAQQMASVWNRPQVRIGIILVVLIVVIGGIYWAITAGKTVYAEKSVISAPVIALTPATSGILEQLYVHEGDVVNANTVIARVGNELIKTKTNGEVVFVQNSVGQNVTSTTIVAKLVHSEDLRVEAHVKEIDGLKDIHVGQSAVFTVDAFGSKKYTGIVDEIAGTSRAGDVVFTISDKREQQDFNVKIRFDVNAYPELKNGMSAKVWIQK